jgi:hypothetical protein
MEEALVHAIQSCFIMVCECGNDNVQSIEDSAGGTDELEFFPVCPECGKKYKVIVSAEVVGVI